MENNQYQPISIGDWIVTYLLMSIPIVGQILLLVWAFSASTHPSKKSWAQAVLILTLISIIITVIFITLIFS